MELLASFGKKDDYDVDVDDDGESTTGNYLCVS
jgi:hypothetical protein